MRYCTVIIFSCLFLLGNTRTLSANTSKDLDVFDTYLDIHQGYITTGSALFWSGTGTSLIGGLLATLGMTLQTSNIIDDNLAYLASGYSILGIGLGLICAGAPLWLYGINSYHKVLERRERYFLITREQNQ